MNDTLSEKDRQAVRDILVEQLGVPPAQLTLDAKIEDDLQADSLTMIEITMALEEHFGITMSDEQLEDIVTVADVDATVARHLSKKTMPAK